MTAKPRYPKSSCCVIGCRRTSTIMPGEWICGQHWRMVDKRLKTFYRKQMRKVGHAWERADAAAKAAEQAAIGRDHTSEPYHHAWAMFQVERGVRRRYWRAESTIWGRIKRQATDRALGI